MVLRPPPRITSTYIENAALHYLERFASSSANLRRVLMRKADRSLAHWGGEREEARAQVDAVLAKLARLGYLDDSAYARQKAAGLHRRGASGRAVRATLAAKGVESELAESAVSALAEEGGDFQAAVNLARRRRLGPFRPAESRADMRARDLAALARAGFDYDTARRVVEAAEPEELDRD